MAEPEQIHDVLCILSAVLARSTTNNFTVVGPRITRCCTEALCPDG